MRIKLFLKRLLCFALAAAMLFTCCAGAGAADDIDGGEPAEATSVKQEQQTTEFVPATTTRPSYLPEDTTAASYPVIFISRNNFSKKIHPGDSFNLTVNLSNSGSAPITSGVVTFSPSEGLILEETGSSKAVSYIGAGSSRSITVRLKVAERVDNPAQSVNVDFRYNYAGTDGTAQGADSEKLNIPIAASGASGVSSAATPYIIVSKYSYQGAVAAGQSFELSIEFENTAKSVAVENIMMSVETGSGLSITDASNTYYYTSLEPGARCSQRIAMQASPNAEPGAASVNITFKYEYNSNGERVSTSSGEVLSIPVFLQDRFTVSRPEQLFATQNQELAISLSYVNKGKGTVNNVEAVLVSDNPEIYCELPLQNLGNFEPGKSGSIDFYVIPSMVGEGSVTVEISYEDEMQQVKKLEIPVHFSVEKETSFFDPGYTDEPMSEPEGRPRLVWVGFGVGGVGIAIAVIVIVRKKKKKTSEQLPDDFDWDDTAAAANASNTEVASNEKK